MGCSALAPRPCLHNKLESKVKPREADIYCDYVISVYSSILILLFRRRAILRNDWNEVVDLILKPRPGGKELLSLTLSSTIFKLDKV